MVLELAAGVIEVLEPIIFIVQELVQELVQEQFLNALEQFFRGGISYRTRLVVLKRITYMYDTL